MLNKRDHIVAVTLQRYRTHGVCGTTLKDISQAAQIPLGNLYYYFKTRDELILAVLDACEQELRTLLARLGGLPPQAWLAAYFGWLLEDPRASAQLGCPFGTLASELRALGDPAAPRAAQIVEHYLNALREQTGRLGWSRTQADDLFLSVQGAYTVSRTLEDASLFQGHIERLRGAALPHPGPEGPALSGQA